MTVRTAFIFEDFDSLWMGGRNYYKCLFNAISEHAKNTIQPLIYQGIPSQLEDEYFGSIPAINTPLLRPKGIQWYARKFIFKIFKKDIILEKFLLRQGVNLISHQGYIGDNTPIRTIGWIPDFQHIHLKTNFSETERERRNNVFRKLCVASRTILVSSQSAQKDLHNFFPEAYGKSHVLNFIGNFPEAKPPSFASIQSKYQISRPYYYIPNQFWKHKNHILVLNALKLLKEKDTLPVVICSGSTYDPNNPDYFRQLNDEIVKNNLHNHFKILGEIPYSDVTSLLYYAHAVINPSLFEGWSTIVEEARNLNKYQILSNIDVHCEQAPGNAVFVNPQDPKEMASAMRTIMEMDHKENGVTWKNLKTRYNQRKLDFARQYEKIVLQTCKQ